MKKTERKSTVIDRLKTAIQKIEIECYDEIGNESRMKWREPDG